MSSSKLAESHHPRPQWKSRWGFILAAIGSAVGLGNIWRFSYLCYKNGGGAFLFPYLVALIVVGIPLMILELGFGHKMRGSSPLSFAKINKRWEWTGWWAVIFAMFGINLYYSGVIAWCLCYVFFSFNLSWGVDTNDFFFNQFLQVSSGPFDMGDFRAPIMVSLMAIWGVCWIVTYFGVQNGVERANKIFMPLLFVLTMVLILWSVNLEGAMKGIKVYLTPDFGALRNYQIWIDAFSQIFFTLSLAFGVMIAYASYLPAKTNIVKDSIIICLGNSVFSLMAGFAVFGTLGYMATTTGVEISDVVKESIGLAFVAYPKAISLMPVLSKLFGFLFFTSLVIAGLSSAVSLVEAFASAIIDKFAYSRRTAVTFICMSGFILSTVFTAKSGIFWLDIADHFITHYGLVVIGILECVAVAWVWKASRLRKHINNCVPGSLPAFWDICVKYFTPAVLIFLLFNDLRLEIAAPYEGYDWRAILLIGPAWLLLALFVSLFISNFPWQREKELLKQD